MRSLINLILSVSKDEIAAPTIAMLNAG